jgi:hypothetical protein
MRRLNLYAWLSQWRQQRACSDCFHVLGLLPYAAAVAVCCGIGEVITAVANTHVTCMHSSIPLYLCNAQGYVRAVLVTLAPTVCMAVLQHKGLGHL